MSEINCHGDNTSSGERTSQLQIRCSPYGANRADYTKCTVTKNHIQLDLSGIVIYSNISVSGCFQGSILHGIRFGKRTFPRAHSPVIGRLYCECFDLQKVLNNLVMYVFILW